ncbi:MAG: M3 family metallopeptidase [Bacteroidaceae bacterium]|nr:M3 family metallopeptidase [Bacteroidaceae bacterium]
MRVNPLFNKDYQTPHNTAPFDRIQFEDYEPAIMEGIRQDDAFIQRIIDNPEPPTFDNTISVTTPDDMLERVTKVFFNLLSAETNDDMDALAQKLSPILTEHANNIMFNRAYFERVKAVYLQYHPEKEQVDSTTDAAPSAAGQAPSASKPRPLTPEEQTLLDKSYEGFVRAGVALDDEAQARLREINNEMSLLTLQFSQNNLKETNAYELLITDEADLSGLPDTAREAAALAAREHGKQGWLFTLHAPSYGPFITYADNRELRRQIYLAKNTICMKPNEQNNESIVARIVNLRRERAQLLGYKTFADYVLTQRMAENAENVYHLFDQLLDAYMEPARRELKEIEDTARRIEGDDFQLQPWDFSYYGHKLKMERYNIDAEMLRPYLPLDRVKEGVFGLATRLYGITFRPNPDIPVYHPDVQAFDVLDNDGSFLAVLYTDFHPRKGKQSGAWMTSYKEQWIGPEDNCPDLTDPSLWKNSRPHVSLVMNFTKPTDTKPALLTLGEVETFLHEFGHALHGIFANTRFSSLSGTNVYWDFVELPSQLMENFAVEPEFLNTFARHYQTGEPIPQELIDRIIASRNFQVAYACIRQVSFGLLDMAYYTLTEPFTADVRTFEHEAWSRAQLFPEVPGTCMSVQFSHIMAGGYAAGYYSYKWAEVLDADAFSVFKQAGIFDRATAQRFRDCILSRGGTEHPMTLYRRFRGGEPTIDALLIRNGIKQS